MWSADSRLKIKPIEIHNNNESFIVEDLVNQNYFEMPEVCVDALSYLNSNYTVKETEAYLMEKFPEEEIDMGSFVNQLIELELIAQIDEIRFAGLKENKNVKGFLWISKRAASVFFNKYSRKVFIAALIGSILLLSFNSSLFPQYQEILISNIMMYNILLFLGLSFILIVIHEAGHVLAARAYNLPVQVSLGHRLLLLVVETDVSTAWRLPVKDRNVVLGGGLYFDFVLLFMSLLFKISFLQNYTEEMVLGITNMIIFILVIRILYQCCFFMKTDLYHIFENISGEYNLLEESQAYIVSKVTNREDKITSNTSIIIKFYSVFYLAGTGICTFLFIGILIPQLIFSAKISIGNLYSPIFTLQFWDGAVFLLQLFVFAGLLIYSVLKKYNYWKN